MAVNTPIVAKPAVAIEERTWRAIIETPRGGPYSIQVYRMTTPVDEDGETVGSGEMSTQAVRRLAKEARREKAEEKGLRSPVPS